MRLVTTSRRSVRTPRRAFTLIELLVVIAIISILMALSVSAILKALGTQQSSNTKSTINRIEPVRTDRWKAAIDTARANSTNIVGKHGQAAFDALNAIAGGDPARLKVIYTTYYLKQQFPITFAEVLLCTTDPATPTPQYYNPLGPNPAYVTKLTTTYPVKATVQPQLGESSVLLLMALEKGEGGPASAAQIFGPSCTKNFAFLNNSAAGLPVDVTGFKDDWGTPLQFYRWSTADPDLDAVPPLAQSKSRNPLDPEGALRNANWFNLPGPGGKPNPNRVLFEQSCYSVSDSKGLPYAYYITPVIVSAGPNMKLGIDLQTMAVTNQADANDNLYSYRLKRE